MPVDPLTDWTGSGPVLAPLKSHLQEPVRAIRNLADQLDLMAGQEIPFDPQERFIAIIVNQGPATSPGEGGTPKDYTDARYWVKKQVAYGSNQSDPVSVGDDTSDPDPIIITATSLLDFLGDNSHNLRTDGTVAVEVFAWWDTGDPVNKHYFFAAAPPGTVLCKIISYDGNGQYKGRIFAKGTVVATAGGNCVMPQGLTDPGVDNALILNTDETDLTGNRLGLNTWMLGRPYSQTTETPPRTIVFSHGGRGRTDSIITLPHGSYDAPDGTTWQYDVDARPVAFDPYWQGFDSGSGNLFMMTRQPTFDARGILWKVSGEVQTTIAFQPCATGS